MKRALLLVLLAWPMLLGAASTFVFGSGVQTCTQATMSPTGNPCDQTVTFGATCNAAYIDLVSCSGNSTVTISGATGDGASYLLWIKQDDAGSRTVTFAVSSGNIEWPAGAAPTMTATASKIDLFSFAYLAATTTLYGSVQQSYTAH